jgi:HD-GYP domain-containing protein (c-di-GMP phosphodiesterase class II)
MVKFPRKDFFYLKTKNRLMVVFAVIYALLLIIGTYFLSGLFSAILCLFLVVFSAVFWGLAGGLISAVWSGFLMAVSTFYLHLSTVRGFLFGTFAYFVIAAGIGILSNIIKKKQAELLSAYDSTIEGWAYALDLKDEETKGHSSRVTEMTVLLAKKFGIKNEELSHIKRGALLHDIGKMGIPDSILLKAGKLTDEELATMQKHPEYAFKMLSDIAFLLPAIDIPYCHHEWWDGTGYPQGLKGSNIPIAARIFAVVDTYDALTNDRPYRKAWPKDKALEYICQQAGKHFDPDVVKVFLSTLGKDSNTADK